MKKKDDQLSFATSRKNVLKFKIVFVGDQNVGKTSIISRFIKNQFDESHNATVGIDFVSKNILSGDKTIRLQLWDTAGQQRFRSLIPNYLRDSQIAFVVYDITSAQSFESVGRWVDFIKEARGEGVLIIAVGNKIDLIQQRAISQKEMDAKFKELSIKNFFVSAKSGQGLENIFQSSIGLLLNLPENSKPLKVEQPPVIKKQETKQKPINGNNMNQSMKLKNPDKSQNRRVTQPNCC